MAILRFIFCVFLSHTFRCKILSPIPLIANSNFANCRNSSQMPPIGGRSMSDIIVFLAIFMLLLRQLLVVNTSRIILAMIFIQTIMYVHIYTFSFLFLSCSLPLYDVDSCQSICASSLGIIPIVSMVGFCLLCFFLPSSDITTIKRQ